MEEEKAMMEEEAGDGDKMRGPVGFSGDDYEVE